MQHDAIILGAGGAGLFCALTAGQMGARVLVIDHNQEPGKKILISGGGVAGLTAAAAFGSAGFEVLCIEPTPPVTDATSPGADLRTTAFLIADGVLPSNEGRGYVLRRIMRRAMRHAHMLGAQDPLMYRLVPALVTEMGQAYPELNRAQALISETFRLEESRFRVTLERGLRLLDEELQKLPSGAKLPGEVAFKLYDTYGFPLDLTEDALRAQNLSVEHEGFVAAMARQRAEARKAWAGSGETATESLWFEIREEHGAT